MVYWLMEGLYELYQPANGLWVREKKDEREKAKDIIKVPPGPYERIASVNLVFKRSVNGFS